MPSSKRRKPGYWVNEGTAAGHPAAVEFIARDGAPIMVRPILPEDKGRLRDGFERLSSTSGLRQFMARSPSSPRSSFGTSRRSTIGTIWPGWRSIPRRPGAPAWGWLATSGWPTILLDLGATIRHKDAGVVEVGVPISADPEDLPDTPAGRTFRAIARREVPPFTLASRRLF